jgi:hypothetical protein
VLRPLSMLKTHTAAAMASKETTINPSTYSGSQSRYERD